MAMNFKIFDSRGIAAKYAADIVRKQMNNNPTSIIAFALNDEKDAFYPALETEAAKYPIDASQLHVFDYDQTEASFSNVGIVNDQYYATKKTADIVDDIDKKAKTKKNKGKLIMLVGTINADGSVGYREINADADKGLLAAREIVLLVTGADKADVIAKLYSTNESNTNFEAGNLKVHRMVTVVLDQEAAQGLPADVKEYYRALFS